MFCSTALHHLVIVKTKHFAYYKNWNNFFIYYAVTQEYLSPAPTFIIAQNTATPALK